MIVPASEATDSPRAAESDARVAPLRVAVVGDSLSAGRSRFLGNGLDDEAWMAYADGDGIEYVGGWARSGATPDEMAEAVQPIDAVDVLVVLAGTNAVRTGRTMAQETAAYERIVEVIRPKRVLVSSIPPYRAHAAAALVYGKELRNVVAERGWTWVDPWAAARDGDDWAPGFSTDGTHPAGPEQYRILGESFRRIILESRTLPSALGA
ncbi:SGNH/GDSL hydrolase family protein [Curtobacterium sp. NPDC089689]|uniref:SGNH/GDSL hydrolase family protein n=1 Tax=Curtobacterium sp. NPDC089689 TaxID=3363968 RepID=UPI003822FA6D